MTTPESSNGYSRCPNYTKFVEAATTLVEVGRRLTKVEEVQDIMRQQLTRTVVIVSLVQTVVIAVVIAWATRALGGP